MVCEQWLSFLQSSLGVDVSSNEPSHEDEENDPQDNPFDYDTFLSTQISSRPEDKKMRRVRLTSVYQKLSSL